MQIRKKRDETKKNSSPLKLLTFEEISIFSNGGHLGYRMALTDTNLKGDHLRMKVPKFELYKHNDELFNIYYGIFYEL
jgi:hypothetical protein